MSGVVVILLVSVAVILISAVIYRQRIRKKGWLCGMTSDCCVQRNFVLTNNAKYLLKYHRVCHTLE